MRRTPWIWILVGLFLVITACFSLIATGAAAWLWWNNRATAVEPTLPPTVTQPSPTAEALPGASPAPTKSPVPSATPTEAEQGKDDRSARIQALMTRIENEVSEIRGLKPKQEVERAFLTREELRKKVEEDFFADYTQEDAEKDVLELWIFGFLNRDFDLFNFYQDLYTDVIAGFYDDEEEKMYVVTEQGFPAHARLTYAHEFAHALQDQYWDIDKNLQYNDETCKKDSEYCGALQALIEGDASLVEQEWFWTKATPQEQRAIRRYYQSLDNPVFDQAPEFFKKDLIFPYDQGLAFVQYLYSKGGWDAVNQAYENPPLSTEQILHPERYPKDKPVRVSLPDVSQVLGEGWESVVEHNALGEFWLFLLLRYGLDDWRLAQSVAENAAEGWGGDAYALYYNAEDDTAAFVMDIRWDTQEDAREFHDAFLEYAQARFGSPREEGGRWYRWENTPYGTVLYRTNQGRTLWVIAPEDLVEALRDALLYGKP